MRFVSAACPNKRCEKHQSNPCAELLYETDTEWRVRCGSCGEEYSKEAPQRHKKSNRYPQISGSLGCVVNSWDEEKAIAKSRGMVPVDHKRVNNAKKKPFKKVFVRG